MNIIFFCYTFFNVCIVLPDYECIFVFLILSMQMVDVIIGLGANTADSEAQLARVCNFLKQKFLGARFSTIYTTPAEGGSEGVPDYCNAVAILSVDCTFDELNAMFKRMEIDAGRTPESKQQGLIPLDIDIVVWGDKIVRPRDFSRRYMRIGLHQLGI